AGVYWVGNWLGLPPAAERPDVFCWVLTVGTAGLTYMLAVLSVHGLGRQLGLPAGIHCAWLASFALSTFTLAYTRHVNSHIMLLEYSGWPGSPFSEDTLTGFARHTPFKLTVYALALLLGKHGFLSHNLPLLLAIPAAAVVLRRVRAHRPELICTVGWCVATWLLYAVLSNNYGGACCSIRWFVPFLAPGYYLLALFLRDQPRYLADFLRLGFWGAVLAVLMWRE